MARSRPSAYILILVSVIPSGLDIVREVMTPPSSRREDTHSIVVAPFEFRVSNIQSSTVQPVTALVFPYIESISERICRHKMPTHQPQFASPLEPHGLLQWPVLVPRAFLKELQGMTPWRWYAVGNQFTPKQALPAPFEPMTARRHQRTSGNLRFSLRVCTLPSC